MTTLFGDLAGDLTGEPGRTPPLVLPGHGESPPWPGYDLEPIADAVHRAVTGAGLSPPVLAGHSAGGIIATIYAARYPAAGVVNVDHPLQVEPFARLVRSLAGPLRGPGFAQVWEQFEASMGIGLLPQAAQDLLQSARYVRQDLVTGYWRDAIDRPVEELARQVSDGLAAVLDAKVPYLFVAGHDPGQEYLGWLTEALPQAEVTVWPGSGHFPHLAQPGRFAELLAGTARWA
jgi:pimeloyl-ACP methyl ester carboxylesterase